jgi:hypothetical protein
VPALAAVIVSNVTGEHVRMPKQMRS